MRFYLILMLFISSLTTNFAYAHGDTKDHPKKRFHFQSLSLEEKKKVIEEMVKSGKKPALAKVWPMLTQEQKDRFLGADKATQREIIRSNVEKLPEEERAKLKKLIKNKKKKKGKKKKNHKKNKDHMKNSSDKVNPETLKGKAFGE